MNFQLTKAFSGKRVFVTGHTGFKGTWLSQWLLDLGAIVHGYALSPGTNPALFDQLDLAGRMEHEVGDLRNASMLKKALLSFRPDFVFHLAAQPLVRLSYAEPVSTYETNVLGTIHLMEALRDCTSPCIAILITTDKCYENKEWLYGYREEDPLGGYDPYSSSKAACEIAIASWRRCYFKEDHPVTILSARAGNVIGGGDWALDRVVPDCIRALARGEAIPIRNKVATRPWQHVLEPLGAYLTLAATLVGDETRSRHLRKVISSEMASAAAFNFGPGLDSNRTVAELVGEILRNWSGEWSDATDPNAVHEAGKLNLATDKAFHLLGWQSRWDFATTVAKTIEWYHRTHHNDRAPLQITREQIAEYSGISRSHS